jgi:hypothetical protein
LEKCCTSEHIKSPTNSLAHSGNSAGSYRATIERNESGNSSQGGNSLEPVRKKLKFEEEKKSTDYTEAEMRKRLFPGIVQDSDLLLLQTAMSILKDHPKKVQSAAIMKFFSEIQALPEVDT